MEAVMSRRAARAFSRRRRPTAGGPTHRGGAAGAEMPVQPEANLSGQPAPPSERAVVRSNTACVNLCGGRPTPLPKTTPTAKAAAPWAQSPCPKNFS